MEEKEFILRLKSGPQRTGDDPYIRLRKALKALVRAYGFRCVDCNEVNQATTATTEKGKAHAS